MGIFIFVIMILLVILIISSRTKRRHVMNKHGGAYGALIKEHKEAHHSKNDELNEDDDLE